MAEDEDDVRAAELAGAHAVERRDEPHAEVLAETSSLAREAGLYITMLRETWRGAFVTAPIL